MPVILTTPEEVDVWMQAPMGRGQGTAAAASDGGLRIVARGVKKDEPTAAK